MSSSTLTTLLLPDLPPGSLCSLDFISFTTTAQFLGIKSLPRGFHFLVCAPHHTDALRHGIWLWANGTDGETATVKWNKENESLELLRNPGTGGIDVAAVWNSGLTAFRWAANEKQSAAARRDWVTLTKYFMSSLLVRVLGPELKADSTSSGIQDVDEVPGLTAAESGKVLTDVLNFLPIDLARTWRPGAIGRERTDAARDRTWALNELITVHCEDQDGMDLVAECSLSFLLTRALGNWSAFQQWKRIWSFILTSHTALGDSRREGLFVKLLQNMEVMVRHFNDVDTGLFDVEDQSRNELARELDTFKRILEDHEIGQPPEAIKKAFAQLEKTVQAELGWELGVDYVKRGFVQLEDGETIEIEVDEDEDEDYKPVVVDEAETIPSDQRCMHALVLRCVTSVFQ